MVVPVHAPHVAGTSEAYADAVFDHGRVLLAEATAVAKDAAPEVKMNTESASGGAAKQLVGRSASAQLVVLGSRGLGGITGLLVGSVAVAVTTHAHCPTVVVRDPSPDSVLDRDEPGVDRSRGTTIAGRTAGCLHNRVSRRSCAPDAHPQPADAHPGRAVRERPVGRRRHSRPRRLPQPVARIDQSGAGPPRALPGRGGSADTALISEDLGPCNPSG